MTRPRQPYSNVSTMFRSLDVRSGSQSVSRRHRLPAGEGRPEPRGDPAASDGLRAPPGMGCAGRREVGRTERVRAGRGWGPGAAITGAELVQEQMWDIQMWRERKGQRGDSPLGVGPRAAGRPRIPSCRRAERWAGGVSPVTSSRGPRSWAVGRISKGTGWGKGCRPRGTSDGGAHLCLDVLRSQWALHPRAGSSGGPADTPLSVWET